MLKVLSKQFQNKKRTSIRMIICIQWELSQYLPMKTFLDFLQFNGLVAFVLFQKNNEKLISLLKEKKIRKHNFVKSPSKEFLFQLLICSKLLKIWQSISIRKHLTQRDKVGRYDRLMNGLPLSAHNCYYKLNRKVPFHSSF